MADTKRGKRGHMRRSYSRRPCKRSKMAEEDDVAEESADSMGVSAVGRHIYFYTDVRPDTILELNKLIASCGRKSLHERQDGHESLSPVYLHINSPGGDVFAALSAVDVIRGSPVPVITIVEGLAASAATLISIVGHERWITENASMLVHQLSSGFWGKLTEIQDECVNLNYLEEKTKGIYLKYTKNRTTAKKLKKWLKRDIYFDKDMCVKHGLADKVI